MTDEQIILSTLGIFKIKYSVLDDLNMKKITSFHIDLNTILAPIFKLKDILDTSVSYKFSITSSIINLAAHFRAYFVKKGWDVKIFIYYSDMSFSNDKIKTQINDSIELMSIISKYIPDLYFVNNISSTDSLITYLNYFLNKYDGNNCIFTKNMILYQFVSNNTYIIRPSRDDSYIINKKNIYNKISKDDSDYDITHKLLSAILSFSGVNEYSGVKGLGIKKTLKMFQKAINDHTAINQYYSNIADLLDDLQYNDDRETVIDTFNEIDSKSIIRRIPDKLCKITCDSYIVDKFSKKDLKDLNVKYFTGFNSLMLQELLLKPKQSNDTNKIKW